MGPSRHAAALKSMQLGVTWACDLWPVLSSQVPDLLMHYKGVFLWSMTACHCTSVSFLKEHIYWQFLRSFWERTHLLMEHFWELRKVIFLRWCIYPMADVFQIQSNYVSWCWLAGLSTLGIVQMFVGKPLRCSKTFYACPKLQFNIISILYSISQFIEFINDILTGIKLIYALAQQYCLPIHKKVCNIPFTKHLKICLCK